MKPELGKILSVAWLKRNGYLLQLPNRSYVVQRIRVVRRIDVQISADKKKLTRAAECIQVLDGIKDRMVYEYAKKDFIPGDLLKGKELERYRKNFNEMPTQPVTLYVVDRKSKKKIFTINTCIDEIESAQLWDPKKDDEPPKLSINKVLQTRNEIISEEKPVTVLTPDKFLTVEDQAIRICERYATGLFTIIEACEFYDTPYIDYVEWIQSSDHLRQIHEQAVRLSSAMNASRQINLLDNIIIRILSQGYTNVEVTEYDLVTMPNGDVERVGKKVKVTKRDLQPNELTHLRSILMNPGNMSLPTEGNGDFSKWTEEQLTTYINSKNGTEKPGDTSTDREIEGE